jgi:hypothetical protein
MKQSLQRYGHIMSADDHYTRWQDVIHKDQQANLLCNAFQFLLQYRLHLCFFEV